ncbi:hypothetical protein C9I98_05485 [Photobacterium sanctipauli]|uniref:Uncharacterized protein n=2 Tax=Photobacterium sanctipauli TaxID=1342794 RepID=A0A2T3NYU4_9GAMM|nr:hypothetical protein [Photobacterium sanctipauli]PSW21388.1 hypothetical protein C9I98_05485 [Photobacterium sanctipauli]
MKAFFEVHLRLVITVWVILLSVLGLLYLMNYMKFDSLMSQVVSSKLDVISSSLDTSIKRVERLGMPLQSASNLKDSFDRAREREANVQAITLIDKNGTPIIQSYAEQQVLTESSIIPPLPESVIRRALRSNEPNWVLSTETKLFSGLQIKDSFNQLAGSIVIEYDKSGLYGLYAVVRLHLLEATVVIFLFTALIVLLAIRFGFGDITSVIKLIHGYSSEASQKPEKMPAGEMTRNFADQIEQSEKMKSYVSGEIEKLQDMAASQTNNKKETSLEVK